MYSRSVGDLNIVQRRQAAAAAPPLPLKVTVGAV
jgi:hypothetical protein